MGKGFGQGLHEFTQRTFRLHSGIYRQGKNKATVAFRLANQIEPMKCTLCILDTLALAHGPLSAGRAFKQPWQWPA